MPTPARGMLIAFAAGLVLTLFVAWPVIRRPTAVIFGDEIVGRHYDAYTVIDEFASGSPRGLYAQPLTDGPGRVLARAVGPVAAYNVVVLLAFPLSAAAAYLLSRYVGLGHGAALIAGLLFLLAPMHLAQAAYHPHVAQTQWIPIYFLALFWLVDAPSLGRSIGWAGAAAALVLSNDYGGFIGAVLTPAAIVFYWAAHPRDQHAPSWRRLGASLAVVSLVATAAALAIWAVWRTSAGSGAGPDPAAALPTAFPLDDIGWYSARWWAYLTPPVDHHWLGGLASHLFAAHHVTLGLLENQLFVGWGPVLLASVAVTLALRHSRVDARSRALLVVVALAAMAGYISLGPWSGTCQTGSSAPACLLYRVAPMFRAYARFGVVVSLGVAVAAGAAAAELAGRSARGRLVAIGLLIVSAADYAAWPWRAHDVLPTEAHRYLADLAPPVADRIFDCVGPSTAEASVSRLMDRDLGYLGGAVPSCADPALGPTLAALGYGDVIVRRPPGPVAPPDWDLGAEAASGGGLVRAATFADACVYRVIGPAPPAVVVGREGFFPLETRDGDFWRWMGKEAGWTLLTPGNTPRRATLVIRLAAAGVARTLSVRLDGGPPIPVAVGLTAIDTVVATWALAPGRHTVTFDADGDPWRPADTVGSTDTRFLTVAFRNERWLDDTHDGSR